MTKYLTKLPLLMGVVAFLLSLSLYAQDAPQPKYFLDPCAQDLPFSRPAHMPGDNDWGEYYDLLMLVQMNLKTQWFDTTKLAYRSSTEAEVRWGHLPLVRWVDHYFWVPWGQDMSKPNGPVGVCAAGLADYQYDTIWISYQEGWRVPGLVAWEVANYFLCKAGRTDWADRHGAKTDGTFALQPDPTWKPPPPRRRAAVH